MGKETVTGLQVRAITAPSHEGNAAMTNSAQEMRLLPRTRAVYTVFNAATHNSSIEEIIRTQANRELLAAIADKFGLRERGIPASVFFRDQMRIADNKLHGLVNKFCGEGRAQSHALHYEGPVPYSPDGQHLPDSPAELIKRLNEPALTSREARNQFALRRIAGIAMLASEIEAKSFGAEDKLDVIERAIIEKLTKAPWEKSTIYSLHDNDTNAVLGVYSTTETHTQREPRPNKLLWTPTRANPRPEQPTLDIVGNTHLKQDTKYTVDIPGIGPVEIKHRIKRDPSSKAIRKALDERGPNALLDPLKDVPDIAGLQFVVLNDALSGGKKVKHLMDMVQAALVEVFEGDVTFVNKSTITTKGEVGKKAHQSENFDFKRFMATFHDLNVNVEFMFHGINGHLNNTYWTRVAEEPQRSSRKPVKKVDKKSNGYKRPDGPAHETTDIKRDVGVLKAMYDNDMYPSVPWEDIIDDSCREVETKLKLQNLVSLDKQATILRHFNLT